jgi:predicted RNA methylase
MGTSKIIMLSGVYVILGVYLINFNSADNTMLDSALSTASTAQAEQLARTGLSLALVYMADNASTNSFSEKSLSTMGGTVAYSASRPAAFPASQSQVVSVGTVNGKQITMTAVFHYYGGRWKIARIFTQSA